MNKMYIVRRIPKLGKCVILADMKKLLAQRRMIKSLNTFYKNTNYDHPSAFQIRVQQVRNGAIPEGDFSQLFGKQRTITDKLVKLFRPKYYASANFLLNRAEQINTLYKSCRDDGFIEDVPRAQSTSPLLGSPSAAASSILGIRISNIGTGLLHPLGFLEIWLGRYPTQKLVVYTIIGTIFSTTILGAFILKLY